MKTDIPTTSGPGTGIEADLEKVRILAAAARARGGKLALASGVTTANVGRYLPYVDAFLVGTGIESAFGLVDPKKVADLSAEIEAYSVAERAGAGWT